MGKSEFGYILLVDKETKEEIQMKTVIAKNVFNVKQCADAVVKLQNAITKEKTLIAYSINQEQIRNSKALIKNYRSDIQELLRKFPTTEK